MKLEDPSISSSSRRESSPTPEKMRAKTIGCMSGIFRLVYKFHNRHRFLTFGTKQETNPSVDTSPTNPEQPSSCSSSKPQEYNVSIDHIRRFSCTMPRSPTLPQGIRRTKSMNPPLDFKAPQALVTGLMELNDMPGMMLESAVAEKRQRLLGALEKCDEDLKALQNIIEMVKDSVTIGGDHSANTRVLATDGLAFGYGKGHDSQRPPVLSKLDHVNRSAVSAYTKRYAMNERVPPQEWKQPGDEDITNVRFLDRINIDIIHGKSENVASPFWTSKAMVESVSEVCRDIAWGEKREIGRIGSALQDLICRDLIEEFVVEMGCRCLLPLPFESCKRRLHF